MADLSTVEKALVALIGTALFSVPVQDQTGSPVLDGNGNPVLTFDGANYLSGASQASIGAGDVKVYRGWPNSTGLDADLVAGTSHVSVFPRPGMARDTTRMLADWTVPLLLPPTVTLTVSGATVTLGGTPGQNNVIGLRVGTSIDAPTYAYRMTTLDTLASAVAALGAMVPGATVSGATITLPTTDFSARNGMDQTSGREIRRQVQDFQMSCFAPSPLVRDALCSAVDLMLAQSTRTMLPDGWSVFIRYHGTRVNDRPTKDRVWRRDLFCAVEYPTVETMTAGEMLFGIETIGAGNGATVTFTI